MNPIDLPISYDNQRRLLHQRTLGEKVPLSIGTAMILEAEDIEWKDWKNVLYVNLRTLLRNLIQSMPQGKHLLVDAVVYARELFEEMEVLKEYVTIARGIKTTVKFYYPDYKNMEKLIPKAKFLPARTGRQGELYTYEEEIKKIFYDIHKEHLKVKEKDEEELFIVCGYELPKGNEPSMVLTHYTTDLLSAKQFPALYLIESHTGKIKNKSQWNTKLTGPKEQIAMIPFNKMTLQICGDGKTILSNHHKLKRVLFDLASKYNWTSVTTNERVVFCINRLTHPADRDILLSFF